MSGLESYTSYVGSTKTRACWRYFLGKHGEDISPEMGPRKHEKHCSIARGLSAEGDPPPSHVQHPLIAPTTEGLNGTKEIHRL